MPTAHRGCVIMRLQRLDLGRFLVYAHIQKLHGKPTRMGLKMNSHEGIFGSALGFNRGVV